MQIAPPLLVSGGGLDYPYEYRVNHSFSPDVDRKDWFLAAIPCLTGIGCVY